MKYTIDLEKYYEEYKEIFTTVTLNADILPYTLYMINIPREYDFTFDEREKLFKKVSAEDKVKIEDSYMNRRVQEIRIFRECKSKKCIDESLTGFHDKEMDMFFDNYGFKVILLEKK